MKKDLKNSIQICSLVDDRKKSFYLIKNFTNCKLSVGGDQRQVC